MNGRIYDPLLGRFLSADIVVQFPSGLQSYNRYSYVMNNPLSFVDPSGFFVDIQGTEEQKKRLQAAVDRKFKQKDGTYTKDYQKLRDTKDVGIVIRFAPSKSASATATAAASKSQTSGQPSKERVTDASVESGTPGRVDTDSSSAGSSSANVQFGSPTGTGIKNVKEVDDLSTTGRTTAALEMTYDEETGTTTFGLSLHSEIAKTTWHTGLEETKAYAAKDEVDHQEDFGAVYSSFQSKLEAAKLKKGLSLDQAVSLVGREGIVMDHAADATTYFWDSSFKGLKFSVGGSDFVGTGWHGGTPSSAGAMIVRPGAPAKETVDAFRAAIAK